MRNMRVSKSRAKAKDIKKTRVKGNTTLSGNLIVRDDVILPEVSIGHCQRKNCSEYGDLADGYWQKCWDSGKGSPTTRMNEYLSASASK